MNAERLLKHYERIADASDAIARLRRFILDLAARGKLVSQDSNDHSASELVKAAAEARDNGAKYKIASLCRAIPDDEVPFAIPSLWVWTRFAQLAEFSAGRTPARHDNSFWNTGEHVWVSIADMDEGGLLTATKETVSEKARRQVFNSEPVQPGTLLMSFKLTIGKIVRLGIPAFHNEAIISIKPKLPDLDPYLFRFLPQFARQGDTKGAIKGKTLNRESIANILLPLPPLDEQRRIVAKVDELMALCDRLEAARAERESTRDRLATASLARLNAPNPETFHDDTRFALNALPALTSRPDQIKQLRQTIRNLAVQGRLVPQNTTADRSNQSRLRADVDAESYDLGAFEKRKLEFKLPVGWVIEPLSRVAEHIVDCPHTTPTWTDTGVLCIRTNQVRAGCLDLVAPRYVSEETYELRIERLKPRQDDILYIREGGVLGVGCRVPANLRLCMGQRLMLIRANESVSPAFLELCINSPWTADFAARMTTGGAAPRVNMTVVRAYPIPIPPLDEQKRIIERVDELMTLCDQLEADLTIGEEIRRRLLDALLQESLSQDHKALAAKHPEVIDIEKAHRRRVAMREAVGCRIVQRLTTQRRIGRVALVKPLYLAEAHCGIPLGGQWGRGEFGPYDPWILGFESRANAAGWFIADERTSSKGHMKVEYIAGANLSEKADEAAPALNDQAQEFERVLSLLAERSTEESEIIATLFAAWNDLLLDGQPVSDAAVIREFREEWQPRKAGFASDRLQTWLNWMRANRLVPTGRGPYTKHQGRLI